ncbi:unnamed protein product [Acanthoscelides obtectus]|uniref:Uncharacterized protein n=1 Tax=Acanthoscelides obtectus TaxID=200917 RepID=A0A9P0MKY2_ACAOB|nr:unnamed protein product [Acanthoscelides obtectus]CAK1635622.1 hypothetical protein AOBTE_LOCUS9394 [Acanthoscelides obtectus]
MSLASQHLSDEYEVREIKRNNPRLKIVGISESMSLDELHSNLIAQNIVLKNSSECKVLKLWPTKKSPGVFQAIVDVDNTTAFYKPYLMRVVRLMSSVVVVIVRLMLNDRGHGYGLQLRRPPIGHHSEPERTVDGTSGCGVDSSGHRGLRCGTWVMMMVPEGPAHRRNRVRAPPAGRWPRASHRGGGAPVATPMMLLRRPRWVVVMVLLLSRVVQLARATVATRHAQWQRRYPCV